MLFESYKIKSLNLKNRIVLSPMCQYKAENNSGEPNSWHRTHLVSRAVGGVGLIFTEMTNVSENGRITEGCLGLYNRKQMNVFKEIVNDVHNQGSKIGIQLAHAGRKSTIKNSRIVGPSPIPFSKDSIIPKELSIEEIKNIIKEFKESAKLAIEAGFDVIEIHAAHGYLLHQFLSPSSNKREDEYGNPIKIVLEVIEGVKSVLPDNYPLFLRISAVEYNGSESYSIEQMINHCQHFSDAGIDLFDVSTGGNSTNKPEVYPGYQVKYAKLIKEKINKPVMSVGRLESPELSEYILNDQKVDLICVGRGLLSDPYWPRKAAQSLDVELEYPGVYGKGI